jgi:hypothetical protein
MIMNRSITRVFGLSLPILFGAATRLPAQGRPLFTWSGQVDREVQITMRGRDVWTSGADRDDQRFNRVRVASALPQTDGYVRVQSVDGRGEVAVVQQPTARNGFTTVVRVRDRGAGADTYRITAYWDSRYGNGSYDRRGDDDDDDDWHRNNGVPPRVESRNRGNGGWNNGGYGNGSWGYGSGTALHWSGNVDNEIEIRLQGRRFDERTLTGGQPYNQRSSVVDGLPSRDVQLVISQRQGRGTVYVAQQPTAYNGYTAIIRVRDPQGGYGYYDFDVQYR